MRHFSLGKRRGGSILALILSLAFLSSASIAVASGDRAGAATPDEQVADEHPSLDGPSFQNLNGFMWYYNTYFGYKFSDIRNDLDNLKRRGIRVLGFFSPYQGDPNWCDGCDPVDFYSVPPQNGTMQDWRDLVSAAHRKGMKVVAYFVNIYMDANSPFFKTAQLQYGAGDRTSREVSSFRWTTNPADPLPRLRNGPPSWSKWEYSPIAGAYYWKLWFGPGFDFDWPGSRAEMEWVEKIWLETGLDGFMWDVGRLDEAMRYFESELPRSYTSNDKW